VASQLPDARRPVWDRATLYLGIGLVALGALFLAVRLVNLDLGYVPWPVWIIAAGLVILAAGLLSRSFAVAMTVPGTMVTAVGLILLLQNATHLWWTWVYAWALVAPGAVGIGFALQGLLQRRGWMVRVGLINLVAGLVVFLLLAALFELVFGLSGERFNPVGRVVIPAALILLGLALVASSLLSRRPKA
jgi:hypothetical protein